MATDVTSIQHLRGEVRSHEHIIFNLNQGDNTVKQLKCQILKWNIL